MSSQLQRLQEENKALHKRLRKHERLLVQQNKFTSMGEMMAHISHQWRQPLMEISSLFIPIEAKLSFGEEVESKELEQTIKKLNLVTQYMSKTIEDFRSFFSMDKQSVKFRISEQINLSVNIIAASLKANNIQLEIVLKENPVLEGFKNEYAQVLVNIINNAKDALKDRKIFQPKININVDANNTHVIVTIEDNAGGIQCEPIKQIFEPFYTQGKPDGTGLGLFMSKLIIENHMGGTLSVSNANSGASFHISIPKIKQNLNNF